MLKLERHPVEAVNDIVVIQGLWCLVHAQKVAAMRVSSNPDDPGYRQFMVAIENGKAVHPFLDGVEVKGCTTADEEKGFVIRCVLDSDGKAQIDPNDPERVWEERVEGRVEIKIV
ncbi:hypothetical protein PZ895_08020 [Mesorhizobium sp. YIM 152430]|uniref:hypothetical protein n=1 Tax=Mesorhizobium sp. YIM 152430 TaxID=3031761 RepID=UPI0023DB49FE|nr:hypothetical protein [Mesorhizobium sp. YIM 152430]MDF1599722.1 hypothetical protein [Mesorhizobium sp. YIM 152430]